MGRNIGGVTEEGLGDLRNFIERKTIKGITRKLRIYKERNGTRDGRTYGRVDEWTDGRTDSRIDGP